MSFKRSGDLFLWDALRFGLSDHPDDLLDVGAYVVSRGPAAVNEFWTQLEENRDRLRQAGVLDVVTAAGVVTTTGRAVSSLGVAELDRCLDGVILEGRDFLDRTVADPASAAGDLPLSFPDFGAAFAAAKDEPRVLDGPLWEVKRGDLLRDGEPWLSLNPIRMGLGDGIEPVESDGSHEQFYRLSMHAAFSDPWRHLRKVLRIKALHIDIDYTGAIAGEEPFATSRYGRDLEVTLHREDTGDGVADAVQWAQAEATEVLRHVHAELTARSRG